MTENGKSIRVEGLFDFLSEALEREICIFYLLKFIFFIKKF